jgi:hypothetical protein
VSYTFIAPFPKPATKVRLLYGFDVIEVSGQFSSVAITYQDKLTRVLQERKHRILTVTQRSVIASQS